MNLVEQLIDQLEITRQQAEGGAGVLLRHAQSKLSPDQFVRVADTIPAISDLIGKAPRQLTTTTGPLRARWQRWFSGWDGLTPMREEFQQLELAPTVAKASAAVVLTHFSEHAGPELTQLLADAWA